MIAIITAIGIVSITFAASALMMLCIWWTHKPTAPLIRRDAHENPRA